MRPMLALIAFLVSLLVAVPVEARPPANGFSASASAALNSSTYVCAELTRTAATDSASQPVPPATFFGQLNAEVTSIVTAVSVDWFLTESSTGEESGWVTDEVNSSLNDHDADATGTVVSSLGGEKYRRTSRSTKGSLWICAKTDAGTATLVYRLHWGEQVAALTPWEASWEDERERFSLVLKVGGSSAMRSQRSSLAMAA